MCMKMESASAEPTSQRPEPLAFDEDDEVQEEVRRLSRAGQLYLDNKRSFTSLTIIATTMRSLAAATNTTTSTTAR